MRMILDNPVQAMETQVLLYLHPQFQFCTGGKPVEISQPHKHEVFFLSLCYSLTKTCTGICWERVK